MPQVTGSFDVKVVPQKADNPAAESAKIGRMSLDKVFHGPLTATSKGEMLGVFQEELGSGGYVALERVSGVLEGRAGSFVLQHDCTMTRGKHFMDIKVVPDSGSGDLAGLSGTVKIIIEGKDHTYVFDYSLPEAQ